MNKIKNLSGNKAFTFFGGVIGLTLFLIIGLLPSIVYGGYAGVVLSSGIFGPTMNPSVATKLLILFGIITGVLSTAGLFTVLGAISGTATFSLAEKFSRNEKSVTENSLTKA